MSSKYVRDAVTAYLAANWTETEIVDSENQYAELPQNLAPWLTVFYQQGSEETPCLGDRKIVRKREVGLIQIIVYVSSGVGTEVALQYAEDARTMMRGLDITGVRFQGIDPPEAAIPSQAQSSEGNYFGFAVACPYYYDFT